MNRATIPVLVLSLLAACNQPTAHAGDSPPLGAPGSFPLAEIQQMVKKEALHIAFVPEAPLGITQDLAQVIPADNPLTRAKVELGLELFFDARLSRDGARACATCHHPATGWATRPSSSSSKRDPPTIANRALGTTQYRDGRVRTLEEQVLAALENPLELGASARDVCARVNALEGYRVQFEAIFGGPVTAESLAKAIAAFERTIFAGESEYDLHERARPFHESEPVEGEFLGPRKEALDAEAKRPLSESALRGLALFFGPAKCGTCHTGQDLSDGLFHNVGVGVRDLGRFEVTQVETDKGAFRTPTLRNVAKTAPYMHDGSLATLRAVVEHYDKGGMRNPWGAAEIAPLQLGEQERVDLVAFLEEGLTSLVTPVSIPRLP